MSTGDRITRLIPCTRTHASHSVLYLRNFTHQCPITSLHKCVSHTVHQWVNSCYLSCNCPQGQRWNNDKIRGRVEPERRNSSRFGVVPFEISYTLDPESAGKSRDSVCSPFICECARRCGFTPSACQLLWRSPEGHKVMQLQVGSHPIPWLPDLSIWDIKTWQPKRRAREFLPTACVTCLWNLYSRVLGSLLVVVKKQERASCSPTHLHVCSFRHCAAWYSSSFTDLNSPFCSRFRAFTEGCLHFEDGNVINVKHRCDCLHANLHCISHLHYRNQNDKVRIQQKVKSQHFLPENNMPLKNTQPVPSWAQVERLIDITHPFFRYRVWSFQNYNEVVTHCLPVAPENIFTPSFTIKLHHWRAVPVIHLQSKLSLSSWQFNSPVPLNSLDSKSLGNFRAWSYSLYSQWKKK